MKDVREEAVRYLGYKARTKHQVTEHLIQKGYDEDLVRETVGELEKYRYIDDMEYCTMYFEYGFEKGRGIARIRRELREKGVDEETIDAAFGELENVPDQFEEAYKIAEAMTESVSAEDLTYDEKRRLKARIGRKLAGRGFSSDVVYRVIDRIL